MSRNRRRTQNQVPIRALSPGILILAILLCGGMARVYFKNQGISRGGEIKDLERQIEAAREQNKALHARIVELSSRAALQKRINDGFVKLVPITQDRIVQLNPGGSVGNIASLASGEVRAVSNASARR